MDYSAASAYVYAKAGGMLAQSFVGTRASKLFSVKSLRELYALLFAGDAPSVPETLLSKEIESRAEKKFLGEYISLIKNYSRPADILVALLRFYDYDNLKEIGAALNLGETQVPAISDIGEFSFLNYRAWPNIQKITENSPVSWYNAVPKIAEQQTVGSRLDAQYIGDLWRAAAKLHGDEKSAVQKLVAAEISFMNVLWVLRLKVYYKMPADDIAARLAYAAPEKKRHDVLAREAFAVLDKEIDSWDAWKGWKYAEHLNPHEEGVVWEIDPSWVEKSWRRTLTKQAERSFHKDPMSVLSLVAWFKIKQHELDCIRTVAEGLRLDVESDKLMDAAGVTGAGASR